jgi:hypothetical protein
LREAAILIVRCPACIARSRPPYRVHAEPVGYPKTDIVCGAPGCEEPGLVWFRGPDAIDYTQRNRVCFPVTRGEHAIKVRVKPSAPE